MKHALQKLECDGRCWRGLLSGVGLGVGAGWLTETASTWLPLADACLQGGVGIGVLAGLAAMIGFFFETSPPRSGS